MIRCAGTNADEGNKNKTKKERKKIQISRSTARHINEKKRRKLREVSGGRRGWGVMEGMGKGLVD